MFLFRGQQNVTPSVKIFTRYCKGAWKSEFIRFIKRSFLLSKRKRIACFSLDLFQSIVPAKTETTLDSPVSPVMLAILCAVSLCLSERLEHGR